LNPGIETDNKAAANIGFAARLAGHWSNGHFISVVTQPGFCLLTCTLISLISSGSGLDEQ
jgi:hypothetical protein